jgi:hypothetical protein
MVELYRASQVFDARTVYDVWIRLVQSDALYDAMLRGEHTAAARTMGFGALELAILDDFAIQQGTRWHVENLRFRAVTMLSRMLGWHMPATLRLVTEGREAWLRDLVYEYLALHCWAELGHHHRFAECERFAAFIEQRVLKRRMPPPYIEAVLAFERVALELVRRAAALPVASWVAPRNAGTDAASDAGTDAANRARPDATIARGPVQRQLTLPVDILAWLRAPTTELQVTAPGPVDVVAYVTAADAAVEIEPLTAIRSQLLAAAAMPRSRRELERAMVGAGATADAALEGSVAATIESWLDRGILVYALASAETLA